ncbi:MAG: hypothetical protein WA004_18080 [Saprospiraceae bacterium]
MKQLIFAIWGMTASLAPYVAGAAVHVEATALQIEEKSAWPNEASWALSIVSFGPFFLGLGMFAIESLFYFITGYSLLVASQIVVFLAIGMAITAIIFGLLGLKRPRREIGRNGIILGLIVIALSALLLIL